MCAVSHRLSAMPGPVALVGAGEFLPAMADFDAGLLASTGRRRPRVVDPADRVVPRRRGRLPALGGDGRRPFRDARRGGRTRARPRFARTPRTRPRPRRSARPISSTCRAASRRTSPRCSQGRRSARRSARPTLAARSLPAARPGPWSSPVTCSIRAPASCRGRCAGGRALGFVRGCLGRAALRRVAGAADRAHRAAGAARVRGPRHRRGDGRRRPRRGVAGPRPIARHGLAGSPPRALPRGRHVPVLAAGRDGPAGMGQSGLTVRKQSEQ